jgi:catechol 2,3-dioxygenase-like lactoylglutathione lyase family enzyme
MKLGYTILYVSDVPASLRADESIAPLGMEIGLVTEDVPGAHRRALLAGASELSAPVAKPWGQMVSYVRAPDGCLVELCTPIGG